MGFFNTSATSVANSLLRQNGSGKINTGLMGDLLDALQGLAGDITDKIVYGTGTNTVATAALSAFVRGILGDADAATFRNSIGAHVKPTINDQSGSVANYSIVAGDLNKVVMQDADFDVILSAAATLGADFSCWVHAKGAACDLFTASGEAINGVDRSVTPVSIPANESRHLICNGSAFYFI